MYLVKFRAQVVRSNKLPEGTAYLVKRGALQIFMKRDVEVETDRDIIKKTTVVTADQHYMVYIYMMNQKQSKLLLVANKEGLIPSFCVKGFESLGMLLRRYHKKKQPVKEVEADVKEEKRGRVKPGGKKDMRLKRNRKHRQKENGEKENH